MMMATLLVAALIVGCSGAAALAQSGGAAAALSRPRAGERWAIDSTHEVTWTPPAGAAAPAAAKAPALELSVDGGKSWLAQAAKVAGPGRLRWKVPGGLSDAAVLRVDLGGGDVRSSGRFAVIASQEVKSYAWKAVNTAAPFAPRDGAGALTYKGKMFLLGGWNPGDKKNFPRICNNEVWSSADGVTWTLVKPNTYLDRTFDPASDWEGRHTAGYVLFQDAMWIVGGDGNQGYMIHDTWNSRDGKTWTRVSGKENPPWAPRVLHYTVAFKDWIWVMGGQTIPQFAAGDQRYWEDIWRSKDGKNWDRVLEKAPWAQRGMIGHSAVFKDRMWVLGGGTYDTPTRPQRLYFNDVWSSADGVNWECHVESAPWDPRQYHDVAVWDDRLWVMEGYDGKGNCKDVWYSVDGVNWYEVANTPWAPRHAASPFVHDGSLWMVAGNNMTPDVWRLSR